MYRSRNEEVVAKIKALSSLFKDDVRLDIKLDGDTFDVRITDRDMWVTESSGDTDIDSFDSWMENGVPKFMKAVLDALIKKFKTAGESMLIETSPKRGLISIPVEMIDEMVRRCEKERISSTPIADVYRKLKEIRDNG